MNDPLSGLENFIRKCVLPSASSFCFSYFTTDADLLAKDLQDLEIHFRRVLRYSFLIFLSRERWIDICEHGLCGITIRQLPSIGKAAVPEADKERAFVHPNMCRAAEARNVSEWLVYWAASAGLPLCNLKLNYILYYIQGYHMKHFGIPLFENDIHAWATGAVVPDVYYRYCHYSSYPDDPIKDLISNNILEPPHLFIHEDRMELVRRIFYSLLPYSRKDLSLSCRSTSPWRSSYHRGEDNVISTDMIRFYFQHCKDL